MNAEELKQKEERLKYLESLLSGYEKKDKSVYELILTETNHPPVNYFMLEIAVEELKAKIEECRKEIEKVKKFVDGDVSAKSKN